MKTLIASDIHGCATACEKLFKLQDTLAAPRLVLLGDYLYHGPRNRLPDVYDTVTVCAMLNSRADRIYAIQGNCDSEVDQVVLNFPLIPVLGILATESVDLYLTHGHIYNVDRLPVLPRGSIFVQGHTHRIMCKRIGTHWVLNPGSVALPRGETPASCLLLDGNHATWYAMDGTPIRSENLELDA